MEKSLNKPIRNLSPFILCVHWKHDGFWNQSPMTSSVGLVRLIKISFTVSEKVLLVLVNSTNLLNWNDVKKKKNQSVNFLMTFVVTLEKGYRKKWWKPTAM